MMIPSTMGARTVPTELNPCARESLAEDVLVGPRRVIKGFAVICKSTTPEAKTNKATRNISYMFKMVAGINKRHPKDKTTKPTIMVCL